MLRLAGLVNDSIVDGPGLRYTVFVQGCPHHCLGCHNPESHSFEAGKWVSEEKVAERILSNHILDGVTFSGGEPFCQAEGLSRLADLLSGKHIVTFTGYTFEYLMAYTTDANYYKELLLRTDILIDGPFILDERDLSLRFRGSRNQRIIDCKQSIEKGRAIPYVFNDYTQSGGVFNVRR